MVRLAVLVAWILGVGTAADVTGTVRGADGTPVVGARVVLTAAGQQTAAVTDSAGHFSVAVPGLPATLDVTAPGFAPIRRLVTTSPVEFVLSPAALTDAVVVSADRAGTWRDPTTGATVLTHADLAQLPAVTLDEALRSVSGFSLFRRSSASTSNPTTHGVTMRGLSASGASRALVLLDGVPLNDGFGGWITWSRVPPDAEGRVDVERGAAGDAFGSDALGGVIRIVTPPVEHTTWTAAAEKGSTGLSEIDLSGARQQHALSLFGATSWFRTDGSIPLAPESRGAVDVPSDATWVNALGRMEVAGRGRRIVVEGWGSRDDRGNGTVLQRNRMSGGTAAVSFEATGAMTSLAARVSFSPNHFVQTFSTVAASRATETLTSTQTVDTDTVRAAVEFGRAIPAGRVLIVGTASRNAASFLEVKPTGSSTPAPVDLRDDTEGVAAELGLAPWSRLSIGAGGRAEWRAAPTTGAPHDRALVGHVSAVSQLTSAVSVRASVASSHRWPTLNELVRNFQAGSTLTLANAALQPESSTSIDGSVQFARKAWLASAGVFHTVVDGAIANVTQPSGTVAGFTGIVRERENAGEAHATGVELDTEIRPVSRVRVRGSLTVVDARFRQSLEPALEGNRLPQVPRTSGSITADVTAGHLVTSILWHAVSSQFDDDRNQFLLAAAYQLDLQIGGRIGPLGWHVAGVNILNARIETGRTPLVTIAPGRAVRVGLSWESK